MIGIVVVSHSRPLARAAVALASEMVRRGRVPIAIAAGLDETTTGTDAVAVADAIVSVDSPDGVVVLLDLGSAVLSAELALELLPDETRARVVLSPAPLVEGLVTAVVTAAAGAGAHEVAAEAANALADKRTHLGAADGVDPGPDPAGRADGGRDVTGADRAVTAEIVVDLPHGLHARPAAQVVSTVRGLDAEVTLARPGGVPVSARSLSRVAALGVRGGERVEVRATGPQAADAVAALVALAARHFGESPAGPDAVVPPAAAVLPGARPPAVSSPIVGSPARAGDPLIGPGAVTVLAGLALGRATPLERTAPTVPANEPGTPAERRDRLRTALATVAADLGRTRDRTRGAAGGEAAAVFDAHLALLEDPEIVEPAFAAVASGQGPAAAWDAAIGTAEQGLAALDDDYLRARAADVRAVGDAVLMALLADGAAGAPVIGDARAPAPGTGDGDLDRVVVLAVDLTPAEAAALDARRVAGVVLAGGSPTAHAAILLRSLGIPAVVGAGAGVLGITAGTLLALDTAARHLTVDPDPAAVGAFTTRLAVAADRARALAAAAGAPAVTRDGTAVVVAANTGSVADAVRAAAAGAEGSGLVRTEFCFTGRATAPDAAAQEEVYEGIAAALHPHRVVLRTLDVGGDKPLAFLPLPVEANPFLGVRGLRVSLRRPDLFDEQLTAILAVAARHPVSVMFPMVTALDELLAARAALERVAAHHDGPPADLRVGMMVEVPGAAVKAAVFAPHVDFFSIGTNDLVQYTLAVERGNGALSDLADALDPGVLGLVAQVCRGAAGVVGPAGEPVLVAVCGEAAADPDAVPVLLGLGVRELSVSVPAVAAVKDQVRAIDLAAAADLARRALACGSAAEVRALSRASRPAD